MPFRKKKISEGGELVAWGALAREREDGEGYSGGEKREVDPDTRGKG